MRKVGFALGAGLGISVAVLGLLGIGLPCGSAYSAEVFVSTPTPTMVCGCSWGVNMGREDNNVADPRNGAACGESLQYTSPVGLPSMLNDQQNSGMVCGWMTNPDWQPADTIRFNKTVVCDNVHLWFQGYPGGCSDPKKFKVEFYEWLPGQDPDNDAQWVERVYVDNYAWYKDEQGNWHNVDQDLDFNFQPTNLTDRCRITVYESQMTPPPPDPSSGDGHWFAIGEMRVRGATLTPTPTPSPTPTETPIPPQEVCIVDNTDPGFSSTGTWTAGAGAQKYGTNYVFHMFGNTQDKAMWQFCSGPGLYEVFVWYPAASNRAADAPYTVYTTLGAAVVRVNQKVNGGQWFSIGKYQLGHGSYVDLGTGATSGYVIADAVRFVPTTPETSEVDQPLWNGYK